MLAFWGDPTFWVKTASSGVVLATPLTLAAVGELVAELAGVINLGVEGMMLVGAAVSFVVGVDTGSLVLAFVAGAAGGAVMALLHAVMSVTLRVNQIAMGLTLTILGGGISAYIADAKTGTPLPASVGNVSIPGLRSIPYLGDIFFRRDAFFYAAVVLVVVATLFLDRTRAGLSLRAVGEGPGSADAAGLRVAAIRYAAVVFGGIMAAIGGAYFSIVFSQTWSHGLTGGRGWIAIALVVFAGWRPFLLLPGALLFGFIDSLNFQLQSEGLAIPSEVLLMMPYVFTLVVLTLAVARRGGFRWGMPAALGVPYEREARS